MRLLNPFVRIALVSVALLASITARSVELTWVPIALSDLIPKNVQGHQGIWMQYRTAGTSEYTDLTWNRDYLWLTPGVPWNVPQISTSEGRVFTHPSAVIQCLFDRDAVVRVKIDGGADSVRIQGTAGCGLGGSGEMEFSLYKGSANWSAPLWHGGPGNTFDFLLQCAPGDEFFFSVSAGSNDVNDWAFWEGVTLTGVTNGPPIIASQPVGQTNWVGADTELSVVAAGTWPFAYQWLRNGAYLPHATNATLALMSLTFEATGDYTVFIANAFGSVTSAVARVSITERPWPYVEEFQGSVGREWSHRQTDVTPMGNRRFLGQFGNDTVSLTLNGLPAHREVTVSFDLFVIHSWDADGLNGGPDVWEFGVASGPTLVHTTFSNTEPDNPTQAFPGNFPGDVHPARSGALETNSLGYNYYGNTVYHLTFTLPHYDDSIALNFTGQGLSDLQDESWGLDNVRVELNPDPTNSMAFVRSTLVPTHTTPLLSTNSVFRVATSGNRAAALSGNGIVQWLDLADPTKPQLLGTWETFLMPSAIAVASNLVYVASWELDFLSTLEIVDFSNPMHPVLRGYCDTPGYAQAVAIAGSHAYVADGDGGLLILDVSNPALPQRLGGFNIQGSVDRVQVSGRYAYLTAENWVCVLDVSDPGNPRRAGVYEAPGGIQSLKVSGSELYLAQQTGELQILDVSDPGDIRPLGSYRSYGTEAIAVDGRCAYLAGSSGVRVLDVSNPTNIIWLAGAWNVPAEDMALMGNYAVVAGGNKGLAIYQLQQSIYPPLKPPVIAGSMMTMTWPYMEGARLQMATNLTNPFWQDIPGTEGTNTVSLPMAESAGFFRLVKP